MIKTGDTFKHTFSYTQEDVNLYAKVSGDTNPLHINEEAGRNSMFGRCIIHGYLGASVFTKMFGTTVFADGNVYMMQNLKFLKPMFTGTDYEAVITVKEIFADKNRILYTTEVRNPATGETTITGEAMLLNKKQYVW